MLALLRSAVPLVAINTPAECDKNQGAEGGVLPDLWGDGGGGIEGRVATYPLCD